MGNFKVGDTFDDIKASFLRKERVSLQNSSQRSTTKVAGLRLGTAEVVTARA